MAILVDQNTIVFPTAVRNNLYSQKTLTAVTSYKLTGTLDTSLTVSNTTLKQLGTNLWSAKLSSPVTFDKSCVLPSCIVNSTTAQSDLDFTKCKIVGAGVTDNTITTNMVYATNVQEIPVSIVSTNITAQQLTVTRTDGFPYPSCFKTQVPQSSALHWTLASGLQ
ncbi:uncharacterized protein LOC112553439 [Pomacea canaliculata]|uniref:uncharacterized protein LOC112553439 n=1 Tax=Pomacea canaliculata TaxID=400727 RepID=UPI000D72FE67|nr:uncharacterized protein LOC112553439 [Pomacea canaliculata]